MELNLLNWKRESIQEVEAYLGFKFISHLVFFIAHQYYYMLRIKLIRLSNGTIVESFLTAFE